MSFTLEPPQPPAWWCTCARVIRTALVLRMKWTASNDRDPKSSKLGALITAPLSLSEHEEYVLVLLRLFFCLGTVGHADILFPMWKHSGRAQLCSETHHICIVVQGKRQWVYCMHLLIKSLISPHLKVKGVSWTVSIDVCDYREQKPLVVALFISFNLRSMF